MGELFCASLHALLVLAGPSRKRRQAGAVDCPDELVQQVERALAGLIGLARLERVVKTARRASRTRHSLLLGEGALLCLRTVEKGTVLGGSGSSFLLPVRKKPAHETVDVTRKQLCSSQAKRLSKL